MLLDDLTAYIVSTGEETYHECLDALKAQGCSFRIEHIRGVHPMSMAFQSMPDKCVTKYFLQVDADMVLNPFAVKELYEAAERTGFFTAVIYGQLYEEGFGVGGSVRLWKRHLFKYFSFRDRRTVDRDLYRRIRLFGFRRKKVSPILGIHRPRHSVFSDYLKAKSDVEKWRYLQRGPELYALKVLRQGWEGLPASRYALLGTLMGALTGWQRVVRSKNIEIERNRFDRLMALFALDSLSTPALKNRNGRCQIVEQDFSEAYRDRTEELTGAKASLCKELLGLFGNKEGAGSELKIQDVHEIARF